MCCIRFASCANLESMLARFFADRRFSRGYGFAGLLDGAWIDREGCPYIYYCGDDEDRDVWWWWIK